MENLKAQKDFVLLRFAKAGAAGAGAALTNSAWGSAVRAQVAARRAALEKADRAFFGSLLSADDLEKRVLATKEIGVGSQGHDDHEGRK